ncbi:hypothetical protein PBCVCVM1_198R [Paramecium bursaria Chlorella virus CVM-1]|nr:hypothetical protein PBCVCVM1_198R [Paramecium bursaria Chlorella virus CVM-1]
MVVELTKLKSGEKKFQAVFFDDKTGKKIKTVRFGARGYEDYTIHKDPARMKKYVIRHQKREDWTRAGKYTPGFWSKHLLWSKPSFTDALKLTQSKVGERIVYKK